MDVAGTFSIIPPDGYARQAPGITPIRLWMESAEVTDAEIDYLKGEYLRAAGVKTWES